MGSRVTPPPFSRRAFLGAGAALAALPAWPDAEASVGATTRRLTLRRPTIRLALLQTHAPELPRRDIAPARLRTAHALQQQIDQAIARLGTPDWLALPEFALTGWGPFSRTQLRRAAIELPGREVETLAATAHRHAMYLSIGAWVRDADWPDQVIPMTVFIDPDGQIIARHWQRHGPTASPHAITIETIESQYVERYGAAALTPVVHTDIGNLSAVQGQISRESLGARAEAGAEVLLLTRSGAPLAHGLTEGCRRHRMFGAVVGDAFEAQDPGAPPAPHGGGSAAFGPDGATIAAATTPGKACVIAELPLGEWRETQRTGAGFCSSA